MSDTKHNLLHLLKIITAPIYGILVIITIILFVLSLILELSGFKIANYWMSDNCSFLGWWEKLP